MLKVGTTEGRFRMIMPDLMAAFEASVGIDDKNYGEEKKIRGFMADAVSLQKMISSGELDLAFSGLTPQMPADMKSRLLLDEQLFFVISDNMLRRYRPDYLPGLHNSENIADLRDFRLVPVCRSLPNLHCMEILDTVLDSLHVSLNCVHVSGHFDLHLELAVRDYAACFCLGMYLSHLERINECSENKLHVFRIKGLSDTNPVFLLQKVNHMHSMAEDVFIRLLEEKCGEIARHQDDLFGSVTADPGGL